MSPARLIADPSSPGRGFVDQLAGVLRAAGWRVDVEPQVGQGAFRPDLLIQRRPLRYVVAVKVVREARRPVIRAMFADAVLQATAYAAELGGRPLGVVAAPRISPRVATEIGDYARRFAPDVAWGFVDDRPSVALHGEGLDSVQIPLSAPSRRPAAPGSRRRADPFSDLGQWMLKVLLAPRLEPKHLSAPRERLMNASHLAKVASVSLPSAARLVTELRDLGFIDEERRDIHLVRVRDLLQSWRAANAGIADEIRARWLIPSRDPTTQVQVALRRASPNVRAGDGRGSRVCLGLFAASQKLGFRFVRGAPVHLYLEDLSLAALDTLGLAPVEDARSFDVIVRRPRFPDAVFRAQVVVDGVPAADLLQCWLDVSNHPARGKEVADQIWRRVLEPRLIDPRRS